MGNFHVFVDEDVIKRMEKLDSVTRKRIKKSIEKLKEVNNVYDAKLDIKKLKGFRNIYRMRVGKMRVLFEIEKNNIYIFDVLPRSKAYK